MEDSGYSRNHRVIFAVAAACALALPSIADAEVYRWVDERGVVNYSNAAPAKSAAVKDLRKVEDRLSVYKQDPATLEMVKRVREQRQADPDRYLRERRAREYWMVPPPPLAAYDGCASADDPRCANAPTYYAAPGVYGAFRGIRAPLLPPGAIAGNVLGTSSFTPGLSTQAGSLTGSIAPSPVFHRPPASFTVAPPARGGGARR